MVSKALFTSNSDEWETPQALFDELNEEFKFDVDVCASKYNHKCNNYFDAERDGLKTSWGGSGVGAIRHIHKLISGLRKHTENAEQTTRLLLC